MTGDRRQALPESRSVASTSRSLLVRLQENEAEAWDRLVALYTPLVYFWCKKLDLPEQDTADVIQDVFKTVAVNIGKFRKDRPQDTFRGWLRTITRSRTIDHFRRQAKQPNAPGGSVAQRCLAEIPASPEDDEVDPKEDEQIDNALFLRALELIRKDFQETTWQAFWRVVVDGMAPKDVAEELAMRPGTVRVAKSRVLHRLRSELGELM